MKISYDDRRDLLYIQLDEQRQPVENVRATEDIVLDMGEAGKIVGIEILDASKHVNLAALLPPRYEDSSVAP